MRTIFKIYLFLLLYSNCVGQNLRRWDKQIDSLQYQVSHIQSDSIKLSSTLALVKVLITKGWTTTNLGRFDIAFESFRKAFELCEASEVENLLQKFEKTKNFEKLYWSTYSNLNFNYGHLMGVTGNIDQQQFYYLKTYQIANKKKDLLNTVYALSGMAFLYMKKNELDSARIKMAIVNSFPPELYNYEGYSDLLYIDGSIKLKSGQHEDAKNLFLKGVHDASSQSYIVGRASNILGLSMAYRQLYLSDSSIYYGHKAVEILKRIKEIQMFDIDISTAYNNLYQHFKNFNQPDSAFIYLEIANREKKILIERKIENLATFQQVLLERERNLSILEKEKIELQNRFRTYFLLMIILVFVILGAILWRGFQQKQRINFKLSNQKEEIQSALTQLKSTQAQLIQSEKMASLGELTAGIAHEIQNPLNFVNNFSEVSRELIDEMEAEFKKGVKEEGFAIANDLKNNLEKINEHGQRASSIVKGMLEHSRTSSGQKEPTDINSLCDEYLKLAYHGLRAKDKLFNATIETHFDPNLPKIEVIPQDLGRVILNLINNAFYAVNEKSKQGEAGYQPTVLITTKLITNSPNTQHANSPNTQHANMQITIKDNGFGIPDAIKDKIFQPFFTTKPTGQGTGLGLSLSYDIVKAHGGELTLESKEEVGTEFTIKIPIA